MLLAHTWRWESIVFIANADVDVEADVPVPVDADADFPLGESWKEWET